MKGFAFILFTFFLSNANAGTWINTKCSNSDATVRWEYGSTGEDQIHLKYANFVEGTLTLDVKKVKILLSRTVTLKEKSFDNGYSFGSSRVYAGKVKIVASEKNPNVLQSYFPENKIQTEVICTTIETAPAYY